MVEQQSLSNQEPGQNSSSSPSSNLNNGIQLPQQQQQCSNSVPKSNSSSPPPGLKELSDSVAKNRKMLLKLREETHQLGRQISKRCVIMSGPDIPNHSAGPAHLIFRRFALEFGVKLHFNETANIHWGQGNTIVAEFAIRHDLASSFWLLLERSKSSRIGKNLPRVWFRQRKCEGDKRVIYWVGRPLVVKVL